MKRFFGVCSIAFALVACNNNPGVVIMLDGGGPGTDAPTSSGTDAPTSTGTDAPSSSCPAMSAPVPSPTAVCARSTLTCLMGATSAAAQQACIEADPNAMACLGCLNQEILNTCTSGTAMCADEYGMVVCCLETACPTGDAACVNTATAAGGACASQIMAIQTCTNTEQMASRCGVSMLCFMAAFAPEFGRDSIPVDLGDALDTVDLGGMDFSAAIER